METLNARDDCVDTPFVIANCKQKQKQKRK